MRTFGTIMGSTLFQDENPGDKLCYLHVVE
jgi:hypothetical protein